MSPIRGIRPIGCSGGKDLQSDQCIDCGSRHRSTPRAFETTMSHMVIMLPPTVQVESLLASERWRLPPPTELQ
jgi:hypothetical protein